tara:strand:+ start:2127 stop:2504 length:378 start_codon:yes stop_codon:yes gene_type:complete
VIKGIGIDLVENDRIKFLYDKYGDRFTRKLLSKAELVDFSNTVSPANYLSKNFASKEALSKALGTGLYRKGVYPSSITVSRTISGKPFFIINEVLKKLLEKMSANTLFLSISDSDKHSIAMVIME